MKKILILFLLIVKPISAGGFLSKYFKSKPKVELTDSYQIEDAVNLNIQELEQNAQERNRLLVKYLLLDISDINILKVLEPLKVEKLAISPEEATIKLENLYQNLFREANVFIWYKFRQEAATLINSGADPNFYNYSYPECSLLNRAVLYQDYFFVYFLLKRGARINQHTLANAKTLKMTELLISFGANPKETEWGSDDPLMNNIVHNYDSRLLFFYVDKFKYSVNGKYFNGDNLLHMLFKLHFSKEKIIILLSLRVNPFEKNDLGETTIDIARGHLESDNETTKQKGQEFLDGVEEYDQIFRETLIEQTKDALPLELQDYIHKFHAGEDAELFLSKDR